MYANHGKNTIINTLNSLVYDYVAFGTGSTPPTPNDTKLETEIFRVIPSKYPIIVSNTLVGLASLLPNQMNDIPISEIGWFVNGDATVDSGDLIARIVFPQPIIKNEGLLINFYKTDTANYTK